MVPRPAGAQADALAQYVQGITDPQERAYVEAQIGPQIVQLNAQRDALAAQAKNEQAAEQGFTQALISHIAGIDWAGPYSQIANSQVAAGKAAGDSLAAANPQGGTAAILNAIGAPNQQVQGLEKLNKNVFTGGGAVLTGTGGTIPSFATAGEGLGVLGYAAAQPGIAAAYGQENMRALLAQEQQQQSQYGTDLSSILAGIPKAQQDYESQQTAAQKATEDRAMSLYNGGLITQRELARQLGLPGWQKYPAVPRGSATAPKIYKDGAGNTYALDLATGKVTRLPGEARPVSQPAAKGLQHVMVGNKAYTFDPNTGLYYDPATGRRAAPTKAAAAGKVPGPTRVNMPLSRALGTWVDGSGVPIPALQNTTPPTSTSGLRPTAAKPAKIGSAPKLVHGQWTTRAGKTLAGPAADYWDGLYKDGYTDGRGRIVKPVPRGYVPGQGGSSSGGGLLGPKGQGAGYNPGRAQSSTQNVAASSWSSLIHAGALHYGLDPAAVLAVAGAEGMGGGVGDGGTSFGPFQLHIGGALPRGKDRAWAESPAGIDYALRQIAAVARGLTGRAAVEAIVRRFERPANPDAEIARAWSSYQGATV